MVINRAVLAAHGMGTVSAGQWATFGQLIKDSWWDRAISAARPSVRPSLGSGVLRPTGVSSCSFLSQWNWFCL